MNTALKIIKVLVVFTVITFIIGGAVVIAECNAKASMPRGIWMCFASTEKTLEPDYDCEARGYHKDKSVASDIAKYKCEDKCYAECKVEACIRKR